MKTTRIIGLLLLVIMALSIFCSCGASTPQENPENSDSESKDGSSFLTGKGEPASTLGNAGDLYIDSETLNLYIKGEDNWVLEGNIKGEKDESAADHSGTDGLDFYPINENECAVAAGKAKLLENIVIPSTYKNYQVTQILLKGFENCNNLKSITIPTTITKIGSSAFYGCTNLENLYYEGTIEDFCNVVGEGNNTSSNPMSYAKNLLMLNENNEWYEVTELEIPDTIENIRDGQLYSFENITKLTFSSSIKSIGYNVFAGWDALETVYYKGTIEDWCNISFENANSNPMAYADKIYMLDENNEWYEVTEVEIPETITEIKAYQFYNFSSLTSIEIQNSVTSIGVLAFYNCNKITSIEIPSSVTMIGRSALNNCTSLESIVIPFVGATPDGNDSYYSNKLGYIFEPQNISGSNEFVPSTLKEVVVTGGTSIAMYAFDGCSSITSITLPDSITSIGSDAFSGCFNIESIVIPKNVTKIDSHAFDNCNITIYCNVESAPDEWSSTWNMTWNNAEHTVYWASEWEYDTEGNPVPIN